MNTRDAIALTRTIAPDLRFVPVYLFRSSQAFPRALTPFGALGYTGPFLDVTCRTWLGSSWRGRGAAIFVNDVAIDEYCSDIGMDPRQKFLGTFLHEVAHVLSREMQLSPVTDFQAEMMVTLTERWVASPICVRQAPWIGHDAAWLRILLHLLYRANQELNERIPLSLAVPNGNYELNTYGFAIDIGDEPERLSHLSLAEIQSVSPPEPYRERWLRETRQWFDHLPDHELSDLETLACAKRLFPVSQKGGSKVVTDLLEKIRRKLKDNAAKAESRFAKLAGQIADGTEPPLATVSETLADSGKTVDDLSQKVSDIRRRRGLQAAMERSKELEQERSQIAAKVAKANQDLEAAERRHNDVTWPLQIRIDELNAAIAEANNARQQLLVSCNDAELLAQLDEVSRESEKCVASQARARGEIERFKEELDGPRGLRSHLKYERNAVTEDDVRRVEGFLRDAEQQLATLQSEAAELKAKRQRIEGLMIDA